MRDVDAVTARLARELADYLYPLRDWMIDAGDHDADVAILGNGRRAILLSYALRRERITRQILLADPVADAVEMYGALAEPRAGLPNLDLAGSEFWHPDLTFRAWLSGWDDGKSRVPTGTALRMEWLAYLRWLARLLEVPQPEPTLLAAIEIGTDGVRLVQADDTVRRVRRLVLAGPAADDETETALTAEADPLPTAGSLAGKRVLVMGDGLAAFDWAIAALGEGRAHSVLHIGRALPRVETKGPSPVAQILRHPFKVLEPHQRAALRGAAGTNQGTVPSNWARTLRQAGGRYGFAVVPQEMPPADLVVAPGRNRSSHKICLVRRGSADVCELADLFDHFATDERARLIGADGTVMPVLAFGTGASAAAGPRASSPFLARYGLVDVLEAISCDLFVEDEGALFASFLEFRTSETFGGKLMETKPSPSS